MAGHHVDPFLLPGDAAGLEAEAPAPGRLQQLSRAAGRAGENFRRRASANYHAAGEQFRGLFEHPTQEVSPDQNVWSYHMFLSPTESMKTNRIFTCDKAMAYVLVFVVIFVQSWLVYPIYHNVVLDSIAAQHAVLEEARPGRPREAHECVPEAGTGPLCNRLQDGHTITCQPPTVRLMTHWQEVDLNADGNWTRSEALQAQEDLRCRLGVDSLEAFDVLVNFVKYREGDLWLHPDLANSTAVHEAYFRYAMGDILMCGYRDDRICPNLLRRDFFEAPLRYRGVRRIGNQTGSALQYCRDLLRPGGACERLLPSSYRQWKVESAGFCEAPLYEQFVYEHPENHRKKSLLAVDFAGRQIYETARTPYFIVYKSVLVAIWLFAMVKEGKAVFDTITWLLRFPRTSDVEEAVTAKYEDDNSESGLLQYTIHGITSSHRCTVGLITIARSVITVYIAIIGTELLMNSKDYIDLVFDAVAMLFVVEIASILYTQVLRQEIREQTENIAPMEVESLGLKMINGHPGLADGLLLFVVIALVILIMLRQDRIVVGPMRRALGCLCAQEGDHCEEASALNFDFWYNYWKHDTQEALAAIQTLRPAAEGQ